MEILKEHDGYIIINGTNVYYLLEGSSFGANSTSDIIFLMDSDFKYINHSFGAASFLEELESDNKTFLYNDIFSFFERSIKEHEEKTNSNREDLKKHVLNIIIDNKELFVSLVNQLDEVDNFASDFRCRPMSSIGEFFSEYTVEDVLQMVTSNFSYDENYFVLPYSDGCLYSVVDQYEHYKMHVNTELFFNSLLNNFRELQIDDNIVVSLLEKLEG